ncbi:MAG: hypothetical protein QNJ05_01850 [Woeseiaceae bacterium]|nr:hypothetical protein [Woeseiaceae bacterium]
MNRDPALQALFDSAETELRDDAFTTAVEQRIDRRGKRVIAGRLAAVILLVTLEVLLESPLQQSLGVAAEILSTTLIPLDNEWLAFALSPINSIAGLIGLVLIGTQHLYRRMR